VVSRKAPQKRPMPQLHQRVNECLIAHFEFVERDVSEHS
jgi:hypothetical protein